MFRRPPLWGVSVFSLFFRKFSKMPKVSQVYRVSLYRNATHLRSIECTSLSEAKANVVGLVDCDASISCTKNSAFFGILVSGSKSIKIDATLRPWVRPIRPYDAFSSYAKGLAVAIRKRGIARIRESQMLPTKIVQMWITAREHGCTGRPLNGGFEVDIPWSMWGGNEEGEMVHTRGVDKIPCQNMAELKIALGY